MKEKEINRKDQRRHRAAQGWNEHELGRTGKEQGRNREDPGRNRQEQ